MPHRWFLRQGRAERFSPGFSSGKVGPFGRFCFAAVLLLVLVPQSSAQARPRFNARSNVASGSVTLIATLETLGVRVAPVDIRSSPPAVTPGGSQAYAVTTNTAIVANRTTVRLTCVVRGKITADPDYEIALPPAPKSGNSNLPVTRTDLLDIRMDKGTPASQRPHSPPEQLDIVAQAL